jgi:hypothetical protein
MEWIIPVQKLEVGKVNIGTLVVGLKPLVPLSYRDSNVHFSSLSILLPHLLVKAYDPRTGRLDISLKENPQTLQKLQAIQSTLLTAVLQNQVAWFSQEVRTYQELQRLFQPMVEGDILHLYCPITVQDKRGVQDSIIVFRKQEPGGDIENYQGMRAQMLQPGDTVRIAMRIQGISFHNHPSVGEWTGKFRLQHRIMAMFIAAA